MTPQPTDVLSYAYLWADEAGRGHDEAAKDRPVVVVLAIEQRADVIEVMVAPVTTKPPRAGDSHLEMPDLVRKHLGLDARRSWIVTSEVNRFVWPGPDLRLVAGSSGPTPYYGKIPGKLLQAIRTKLAANIERKRLRMTDRSSV